MKLMDSWFCFMVRYVTYITIEADFEGSID